MTLAAQARQSAGLSLEQASVRVRVSPRYLRHVERHGAPYALAVRLGALYGCSIHLFLPQGRETPVTANRGESRKSA